MMKSPAKENKPLLGLKTTLLQKGITQKQLAMDIGMNRVTLNQIINGMITLTFPVAEKIAESLDISLYDFY